MSGFLSGFRRSSDVPPPASTNEDMEPIPVFPSDTSYDTKLKQLNPGPTVSIHFGSGPARFSISQRLLIYHSPQTSYNLLVKQRQTAITLRAEDEEAFNHLHHFLTTGNLSIPLPHLGPCTQMNSPEGTGIRHEVVNACTMLVQVHHLCSVLGIEDGFRSVVENDLQRATALAEEIGMSTPLSGTIVMKTYTAMVERGEKTSKLWEFVLDELSTAFSRRPCPEWEEYQECFLIPSLNQRVFEHMHRVIVRMLDEKLEWAVVTDSGRKKRGLEPQLPIRINGTDSVPAEECQIPEQGGTKQGKRKRLGQMEGVEHADVTVSDGLEALKKIKVGEGDLWTGRDDTAAYEDVIDLVQPLGHNEVMGLDQTADNRRSDGDDDQEGEQ